MKNSIKIDDFLNLQKIVKSKMHYRDACGSTLIQIENITEEDKEKIINFFNELGMEIEFSKDEKYFFIK